MRQASAGALAAGGVAWPALACGSNAKEPRGAAVRADGLQALPQRPAGEPRDAWSRDEAAPKAVRAVEQMPPARVLGEPGRRRRRLSVALPVSG